MRCPKAVCGPLTLRPSWPLAVTSRLQFDAEDLGSGAILDRARFQEWHKAVQGANAALKCLGAASRCSFFRPFRGDSWLRWPTWMPCEHKVAV